MLRIAINGYGRIGRNVHRLLLGNPNIEIVAINSRSNAQMRTHLFKYDSLHGKVDNKIEVKNGNMFVDDKEIKILSIKEKKDLPWKKLNVDVVLEATGQAKTYEIAAEHLEAGAKKVLVTAPMKDDTPTFVFGINEEKLTSELKVISNASCTTNCIAPVLNIIDQKYGIENVFVSSIHSFTHSQNLLDNTGRDLRRSRSAVQSVIPTTTGSIAATSQLLPNLEGKIDGLAYRVPIATSSVCDVTMALQENVTAEELNEFIRNKAKEERLNKIVDVCDEPLVSIDFKTNTHSSILDSISTKVLQGKHVQLLLWYDNEWGYAARLVDMLELLDQIG